MVKYKKKIHPTQYSLKGKSNEGIKEFKNLIDDNNWVNERVFYGAFNEDNLL